MEQSLPYVGLFSGNIEAPIELGGESDHMLSKVFAVMSFHGFDKDMAVFSNLYYMPKANDCPYTKRWPIDIEAALRREGN